MKVLLVYPEYPDTFWSFKGAMPFIGKKASLPPLGLTDGSLDASARMGGEDSST